MSIVANRQTNMEKEILSQPQVWEECLRSLSKSSVLREICAHVTRNAEWLFIGCGSSYYIAQAAAATFTLLGLQARAAPASEVLLFPELTLELAPRTRIPVLISRSGRTSEVLQAAEFLEKKRDIRTVGITCSANQPLEGIATFTLHTLAADESSTVMTRSFTAMLLGLQYLGASVARKAKLCKQLESLPENAGAMLPRMHASIREFVSAHGFSDYVFLAQGPLAGIARECALKVTESSLSYAQAYHTMEFRHGPKSIVAPDVLTVFLLSESSYEAELEMLEEVKSLGGTTIAVANGVDERAHRASDLAIELNLPSPEILRLAVYVPCGQLLGLCTALKKGLNPDEPRHLSRVVILNSAV
jgi:glucosamine--fructose-6-phosphate aminotransferase (isomerizing)